MTAADNAVILAKVAAQAAADKLAKDILLVDVSDRLAITDVFVIVTGANERQVGSIVDGVEEQMRAAGSRPPRREGERDGRWVLLDFVDIIVHVQHAEERVFYALDRLWKDCPTIPWVDATGDPASAITTAAPAVDESDTGMIDRARVDDGVLDEAKSDEAVSDEAVTAAGSADSAEADIELSDEVVPGGLAADDHQFDDGVARNLADPSSVTPTIASK